MSGMDTSWRNGLPVGLIDWLEHDFPYKSADLAKVAIYSDQRGQAYNIRFVLKNGYSDTIQARKPYYLPDALIEGYNDIFSPNVWLDRMIMRRRMPLSFDWSADAPNYALFPNAMKIYLKIAKRPDDDPFLFSFASRLLNDPHLTLAQIIPTFRMMVLFIDQWKPRQICTAAYQAYCAEIAVRGSVSDCA